MTRQCDYCGNDIKVQIFVGERYCSDNCRKALGIIIREAYKT
jgi:predicted nucleic acid-binding Zn ribbon protein